jgi:hypothetical protein
MVISSTDVRDTGRAEKGRSYVGVSCNVNFITLSVMQRYIIIIDRKQCDV